MFPPRNNDWDSGDDDDDEDEEADAVGYDFNDGAEEDEFGLPSLSSMRKKTRRRPPTAQLNDPGGGIGHALNGAFYNLDAPRPSSRPRANSSDIALERGPPSYPATKGGEGKILRPQYKDILRGKGCDHWSNATAHAAYRPSKLFTSHCPSSSTSECQC